MNSILSVRRSYEQETNVYNDVKNFQQQPHHSESFVQIMTWLQEYIEIHYQIGIPEVESDFVLECNGHQIIFKALVVQNSCIVKSIEYRHRHL